MQEHAEGGEPGSKIQGERSGTREKLFKVVIASVTAMIIATIGALNRVELGTLLSKARRLAKSTVASGQMMSIEDRIRLVEEERQRRWAKEERPSLERAMQKHYETLSPQQQAFLHACGLAPTGEDGERSIYAGFHPAVVPSGIFTYDGDGHPPYRLLPDKKAFWLSANSLQKEGLYMPLLPDTPEVQMGIEANVFPGLQEAVIPGAIHTTNSWGLRGPEPDLEAAVRVMVLGDSYMHGFGVGDKHTPPQFLAQHLEHGRQEKISVLNTGVSGYGPEEYYYSYMQYVDRFKPHAVIVSVCANDCGGSRALSGEDNEKEWRTTGFYLRKIWRDCTERGIAIVFCPVPEEPTLERRNDCLSDNLARQMSGIPSASFLSVIDAFTDENLRRAQEHTRRTGEAISGFRSFLHIQGDGHLNPDGANVWGREVARRVLLLLPERKESIAKNAH